MADKFKFQPFECELDDPFRSEHRLVSAWTEEVFTTLWQHRCYGDIDLKSLPTGQELLEANPEDARRIVLAAVIQARHWDQLAEQVRNQAKNASQRMNAHFLPGWEQVWGRRRPTVAVLSALMRRKLPFEYDDLLGILRWCNQAESLNSYHAPIGHIVRALERFAGETPLAGDLLDAARQFASKLRSGYDKDAKRFGTAVEQLFAGSEVVEEATLPKDVKPAPAPAPAGTTGVLYELKRLQGMVSSDDAAASTALGPDEFRVRGDSPLLREHQLLSEIFQEVVGTANYYQPDLRQVSSARKLLQMEPAAMGRALLAAAERHVHSLLAPSSDYMQAAEWQSRYAAAGVASVLLRTDVELPRDGLFDVLLYVSARPGHERAEMQPIIARWVSQAERENSDAPLTEGERYVLSLFRVSLVSGPPLGRPSEEVARLTRLIGDGAAFCLVPGEAWTDRVNDDFTHFDATERRKWSALFAHALTATAARPSAKWIKTARALVAAIGSERVGAALARWLPLVGHGQTQRKLGSYVGDARGVGDVMHDENATCLRGLLWTIPTLPHVVELARAVTTVALSAYKKVPGIGPRAVKVGNAAVYALSQLGTTDAVGQLAMLKVRVKFGTAQKEIEKAFNAAAEALGLPRDQIEEMAVPSYGLEEVGRCSETFGDYHAELLVTGSDAELKWFDAKGKALKSVPSKVKSEHKDELKALQQSLKDIQAMLPAQRDRIDQMYLLEKSWPVAVWRERYANHPLVGTIARRLIWCVDRTPAIYCDGALVDVTGKGITHGQTAEVTLWHPVGQSIEAITSWRRRLEELGITQPFKQAHREVYLLTDAERNTGTYSNRFAAHIIRQHQFNALCAARGWRNKLRLMVDDVYPPASKELPNWSLRAEFWIEGVGQDYGVDTNDTGTYLRLATDQVRFYRTGAAGRYAHAGGGGYTTQAAGPGEGNLHEPLPLAEIPPLVFTEIMRDVDLFVGVASIGNDPTWQDGGPQGRYQAYWQDYSFGELSGSAVNRKEVLERLIPRLAIADRCSFGERFLVVRGDKRTYKIHFGSGNILMEPNDQYLCIVPDARARATQDELFLPFEGDSTLSIIISKAFLLASDTKIKDPMITRQIDGR